MTTSSGCGLIPREEVGEVLEERHCQNRLTEGVPEIGASGLRCVMASFGAVKLGEDAISLC